MVAVKKNLRSRLLFKSKETESVYSIIKSKDNRPIIIGAIYRPPESDIPKIKKICSELKKIAKENKNALFWIGGDLNLPDINWDDNSIVSV